MTTFRSCHPYQDKAAKEKSKLPAAMLEQLVEFRSEKNDCIAFSSLQGNTKGMCTAIPLFFFFGPFGLEDTLMYMIKTS
jgi:hypothetical protein